MTTQVVHVCSSHVRTFTMGLHSWCELFNV